VPFTYGSYVVSDVDAMNAALNFDANCLDIYDFGGRSAPDGVDANDIGRLVGSHMVGLGQSAAAELIRLGPTAPWAKAPIDARLEDAAPGTQLYLAAGRLLDHFRLVDGVGPAVATKLLAMKRPTLFPIIDSRVDKLYKLASRNQQPAPYPVTAAIRADLVNPADVLALQRLRSSLRNMRSRNARRLAQLPGIRLRDIIIWQRWTDLGIGRSRPPTPPRWPAKTALIKE
jgi:hypothetical protein